MPTLTLPLNQVDIDLRRHIVDHFQAAVTATATQDSPFPHLIVRDLFPADVYEKMLDYLPPTADYQAFLDKKYLGPNGEINRKNYPFEKAWFDKMPAGYQEFWYTIRSALGSMELKQSIYGKLSDGLAYRFGCSPAEVAALPGFAKPELYRETAGYSIKPHPDTRKKVVTMQIALPRDESQQHLGTEFYSRSLKPAAWLRTPKGFDIVKTTPFLPNTAYAFVVLNTLRVKSWHGRSTLGENWGVRDSILNIWYDKAQHGNAEINAENGLREEHHRAA